MKKMISVTAALCVGALGTLAAPGLGFVAADNNEFTFDTGMFKGKLRAGGRSMGLSSVTDNFLGRLDASMGLLGHYRVFTANKRYGTAAWDWLSEARLAQDGSVEVHWPATPDRPFELRATYRWASPNTVDLETTVKAKSDLQKFESFVASYFTSSFTNAAVDAGGDGFTPADPAAGTWQAFPRDEAAVSIIKDGRWKIEPNPVDWVTRPALARPLGVRISPSADARRGLEAILMAPPADCFAILTPHQAEPHYSMYLSLFGRDVKAGETARAQTRLCLIPPLRASAVRTVYSEYIQKLRQ